VHPVFLLTVGYFLVGAAAIVRINRRRPARENAERWAKYGVYLLVVHLVIAAILAGAKPFACVAAAVVAIGLGELVRVTARAEGRRRVARAAVLAVFGALGFGFLQFARQSYSSRALFVYVIVLTFDGFSQVTGQLLGRRQLAPRLSPGKTIEGLAGGLAMAALSAFPLAAWTGLDRGRALGLAVLVALSALGGDLAASAVKRACKVKDYGRLLPGHGGILDRFDSFIAAGCVYWSTVGR
jgi:phosphatidate cytidylyltransferase